MDALKLYGRYAAQSIKSQMEYRASLFMQLFGQFLITAIEFTGVWALFTRFGNLKGWTLEEVAFCYGLVNSIFALYDLLFRGFDVVGDLVRSGQLDRCLLRPRSLVLQLLGHEICIRRLGRLIQGLMVLFWAMSRLPLHWTVGKVLLLIYTLPCGVLFFGALSIIQGSLAIKAVQSLEFMNVLTYGGVQTVQFPLSIYTRFFQRFFTFVIPLGCITYFPSLILLDKSDSLMAWSGFGWVSPLGGVLFFALSFLFWRQALRWYVSTGS